MDDPDFGPAGVVHKCLVLVRRGSSTIPGRTRGAEGLHPFPPGPEGATALGLGELAAIGADGREQAGAEAVLQRGVREIHVRERREGARLEPPIGADVDEAPAGHPAALG